MRLPCRADLPTTPDADVKGLKAALPNLEVFTGWDIAELKKKADEEKK